jgi:quinoprotein relay system zinc metallohydrolase 2
MTGEESSGVTRQEFLRTAASSALLPFLPVISRARAAAIGVVEIAPGIFVHQGSHALVSPENAGDIANASFIVGAESVAVIDSGGSARVGAALAEAIAAVTNKPIRTVINTHMHPDHVFGNAAFEAGKPEFVAHHKMARGLSNRAERYLKRNREMIGDAAFEGTKAILPTKAVQEPMEIDLGGRVLTLTARPTAHTDNDLTIFDPATGTLFLGDLLFSGHIPTLDGSILGWLKLIGVLEKETASRVVPGHGPPSMPWPDALGPVKRYWTVIATDVRAMIKDGKTLSEAAATAGQSEKDSWKLFDEHHVRNVTGAFAELEWE